MKKYKDILIQVLLGAVMGGVGAAFAIYALPDMDSIWDGVVALVALVVSFYLHIILHEGGHLVCGLLSGYKFVSFRIGSVILIKAKGKYAIKKFNIPGTGGQCLLDPPEMVDGKYPAKLYNFGGGLSNLLFSVIALAVMSGLDSPMATMLLFPFGAVGIAVALMNLIPLKMGGIANDGYNLLSLDKDPVGSKAFWQQLRVNKLQTEGVRLKDMDDELFDLAQSDVEGNPLVDQMKLFWMQRLMDDKRFDEAEAWGKRLVASLATLDLLKHIVNVELLYLELVGPCREAVVKARYNKSLKKWLKMVKGYPSTHRLKYAYAVRFLKDEKMASRAKLDFQLSIGKYPMAGEIETEKELFQEV